MYGPTRSAERTDNHRTPEETIAPLEGAIFYQHPNFQMSNGEPGSKYWKDENQARFGRNDQYSSLKVAAGCQVTMYVDSNFNGNQLVLPPTFQNQTSEYPHLSHHSFDDKISSVKVTCSHEYMCEQNPDPSKCKHYCFATDTTHKAGGRKNNNCGLILSNHCSNNLSNKDCREYCMDLDNACNSNMIEEYCKKNPAAAECACYTAVPRNRAEARMATRNGGQYTKGDDGTYTETVKGNNACWSTSCRQQVGPKSGQLHLTRWWEWIQSCKVAPICEAWFENTNINMYDRSVFTIDNSNCGGADDVTRQTSTTNGNTGNTGDTGNTAPEPGAALGEGPTPDPDPDDPPLTTEEQRNQNLMFLGIGILVFLVVMRSSRRNYRR